MIRAPALFVSHGSPMFAVEPGVLGPRLIELGARLRDAQAILVVSPHWQTRGVRVSTSAQPETIHDFGGFPDALYHLRYPAPGAPELARRAATLLREADFVVEEEKRGLDHGAWVPLLYLRPDGGIPVFQVSMPHDFDPEGALRLGTALQPLRDSGVVILASGSLTHNLNEYFRGPHDSAYAVRFAAWARDKLTERDTKALLDYRASAPYAARAHPSAEHFLPLLVAIGSGGQDEPPEFIAGGIDRVLSMDSYAWGIADGSGESHSLRASAV